MRAAALLIACLVLTACTQAGRERSLQAWCDSADNCTSYDDAGNATSRRDLCEGNRYCPGQ